MFGMTTTDWIQFGLGVFVGLVIGNAVFRAKVVSFLRSRPLQSQHTDSGLKFYARDGSRVYHVRRCYMLDGSQFDEYNYKEVGRDEILRRQLVPDKCVVANERGRL